MTPKQKTIIKLYKLGVPISKLARKYKVNRNTISCIVNPEFRDKENAYHRNYIKTEKFKAWIKAYNQLPEQLAKRRAYYQRPEVKAKAKKYYNEVIKNK